MSSSYAGIDFSAATFTSGWAVGVTLGGAWEGDGGSNSVSSSHGLE